MGLSQALLPYAGEAEARLAALSDLEEQLGEILQAARRSWPTVVLSEAVFLRHLGVKLAAEPDPCEALGGLFTADLFLACACAEGVTAAILELEARFLPRARAYFVRNGSLAPYRDELLQLVRARLLVSEGAGRPRIADYSGRAPFGAWFRIVVTRLAINFSQAHKLEDGRGGAELFVSREPDPELAYLKTHHARDLDTAFRDTLASLPAKTANLLRLYYLEGVPADAIGTMNGVSGRTVQRWISAMRAKILGETQARLGEKLRLSSSQVGSLIALVQSHVDVSIWRFLDDSGEP